MTSPPGAESPPLTRPGLVETARGRMGLGLGVGCLAAPSRQRVIMEIMERMWVPFPVNAESRCTL